MVRQARYEHRGENPQEVIDCIEVDTPEPAEGQALVAVVAAPINPSDILTLTGEYGMLPPLPAVGGNEGVGRVLRCGPNTASPEEGQLVLLPMGVGTWCSHLVADVRRLIPLPNEADARQLAMIAINPPTASLLLTEFVDLHEGDWVIQNAANSAVGGYLVQLAALKGLRTINVVRRESVIDEVTDLGGDVVLTDGDDLSARVREATSGAKPRLAIDAVGGSATERLASCLEPGGTIVNYGAMSGEPCQMSPRNLVFRDITLKGFWLASWFEKASAEAQKTLFGQLTKLIATDKLQARIAAEYDVPQIKEAVARAASGEREGKVLIVPSHDA